MPTILLHTSKTMRDTSEGGSKASQVPLCIEQASYLADQLKKMSVQQLQQVMNISPSMAEKTADLIHSYDANAKTLPAIDAFLGDIYSGLQVQTFSAPDREYANHHLYILSGLYGVLRALDTVQPYRLEMGYKIPNLPSMYVFWGDRIAKQLPENQDIVNLSAVEYTKAVFPHFKHIEGLKDAKVITPKFLTYNHAKHEAIFVTVHAKIARGAFARWMIQHRVEDIADLKSFNELGYTYNKALSTEDAPVFVAKKFEGLGLSVRLS